MRSSLEQPFARLGQVATTFGQYVHASDLTWRCGQPCSLVALRLASWVICVIVIASFAVFAVDETGTRLGPPAGSREHASTTPRRRASGTQVVKPHESALHEALDEASNALTSPFSGITAGSSSEWTIHGVNLLLALVVYGFGFGFLARAASACACELQPYGPASGLTRRLPPPLSL